MLQAPLPPGLALLAAVLCGLPPGSAWAQTFETISSPCPLTGACPDGNLQFQGGQFGTSVVVLDFDGDGHQDVAVGEAKQDCVYLFRGPNPQLANPIRLHPSGPFLSCPPPPPTGDEFGSFLAKGQYDGAPGEELFVGAPGALGGQGEVHVYSRANPNFALTTSFPGIQAFGTAIAVADLDGDDLADVAVGAPSTPRGGQASVGTVHVFSSALAGEIPLLNPGFFSGEGELGNYGAELAVQDADGNGHADLFACASGNALGPTLFAGAVYLHRSPVVGPGAPPPQRIDDPNPVPCEFGPRFGKAIDARDDILIVGAPRKEHPTTTCTPNHVQDDPGGATAFIGPAYTAGALLPDRSPGTNGLFGFNVLLADLRGGPAADLVVISMKDKQLQVWDRTQFAAGPLVIPMPPGAVYWGLGTARGEVDTTNAKEEILLGDPRAAQCAGRVLLLKF